jgi:predicted nucleotidyltransferase
MKTLAEIKEILSQCKPIVQEKFKVKELGIFGSYLRQEQTNESDIDVLVEFEPGFRFGLITFCELEDYLTEMLGVKVDLVMKQGLKPRIGKRILSEVIYL